METYMGQIPGWACGLAKEDAPNQLQKRQLNDLRMKYTAKLLLHSENENKRQVTKSVRKFLDLGGERIHELYETGHKRIQERMILYVD
ncbi:hypothetical protein Hanom_Chr07g00649701 [Helianthus anomalus]